MAVKYSEIRDTLKTGDLVAWRIRKISSIFDFILILYQKIFKAKFSHVGIVVRIGKRVFVVEATPPRVRIFPLSMCDDFYLIRATNLKHSPKYLNLLFKQLGKKYSILDLAKGIIGFKANNQTLYCSELAKEFYKNIGYIDDNDAGLYPDKLVNAVMKVSNSEPIFISIDRANLDEV